ncbi:response regulator [candidate division KSB1 bacterium]|nr:response regulator [candidate division KSB1 bacterium]
MNTENLGKKVLVVDDDLDFLTQIQVNLEAAGFEVETAESQKQAEEYLEQNHPDVAVVDLMMEHPDAGFALSYHIKKKDPTIPVILVTAVTSETGLEFDASTDEERSWVKADAFLAKPVRIEQLIREINRFLEGK